MDWACNWQEASFGTQMLFLEVEDNHLPVSIGTVFGAMFPSSDCEVFPFLLFSEIH